VRRGTAELCLPSEKALLHSHFLVYAVDITRRSGGDTESHSKLRQTRGSIRALELVVEIIIIKIIIIIGEERKPVTINDDNNNNNTITFLFVCVVSTDRRTK
jgi:hypothetical protein